MRPCAHEDEGIVIELVNQQKVAADMTLAVIGPVASERVVKPFWTQRRIVGNQQQHRLSQAFQVITARTREAFPVFEEGLGVVARSGRCCPLTASGPFRGHRSGHQQNQNGRYVPWQWRGLLPSLHGSWRWAPLAPAER